LENEIIKIEETKIKPPIEKKLYNESTSPSFGNLAGALAKAQGSMSNGSKDKQGFGYKYMELGTLMDIARPALSANGIAIIQTHELIKGETPSVVTHTTIMHESGEWHKSSIELPIKLMPQLSAAQMIGVNCTYGRRYALQSVCLIASEEDTDASSK
jgi:hypothetical protein